MAQPRPAYSNRQKAAVLLLAAGVPLLLGVAGVLVVASWLPDLPERIAIHWGGEKPDGFAGFWEIAATLLWLSVLLGGVFSLAAVGLTDASSPVRGRLLVAGGVASSTAVTVGLVATVGLQRGGAEAPVALQVGQWLLVGLVVGVVLGAVAYLVAPRFERVEPGIEPQADPIELSAEERAVWTGVAAPGRRFVALYAALVVLLIGGVAFGAVDQPVALVVVTVVLVVSASVLRWRVVVSRRGFTARGLLGLPVLRVPLAEVESARVVPVGAMSEFGGWGLRFGGGRTGVILRSGEAIEVTRTRGRAIVVTVDDAETAAALLVGFVARARA